MPKRRRIWVPLPAGVDEKVRQEFLAAMERLDNLVALPTAQLPDEGQRATLAERVLTRISRALSEGRRGAVIALHFANRQYWRAIARAGQRESKYDWKDPADFEWVNGRDEEQRAHDAVLVGEMLRLMTEEERWVARHVVWHRWSWAEIGQATGRSADAARVAFERTLARVRAEVEAKRPEGKGGTRQDGEDARQQPPGRVVPQRPPRGSAPR